MQRRRMQARDASPSEIASQIVPPNFFFSVTTSLGLAERGIAAAAASARNSDAASNIHRTESAAVATATTAEDEDEGRGDGHGMLDISDIDR